MQKYDEPYKLKYGQDLINRKSIIYNKFIKETLIFEKNERKSLKEIADQLPQNLYSKNKPMNNIEKPKVQFNLIAQN